VVGESQVRRGDIYLIDLIPTRGGETRGGEIRKTRPCVIVSPDELNAHLRTFIVAPMTSGKHAYPFRLACRLGGRAGHVVLDQIRTVDQERLVRRLGRLSANTLARSLSVLQEMFAP
jgi:mRNA interferase MazF